MWSIIQNISIMPKIKHSIQTYKNKHPMSDIAFMQQEIILPIKNKILVQRFNVDKNSLYGKEIYFRKGETHGTN